MTISELNGINSSQLSFYPKRVGGGTAHRPQYIKSTQNWIRTRPVDIYRKGICDGNCGTLYMSLE